MSPGAHEVEPIDDMDSMNSPHEVSLSEVSPREIRLRGVRVHNLKNIDLDIPHHQWLSICGLSGSGKTSLALDTLYAEGQRRYMESLSPYTRQFLQQLEKPDATRIDGIPPSVAVRAVNQKSGARTTVGSTTGTTDHLRLLFSKIGKATCPDCDLPIRRDSPDSASLMLSDLNDVRFQIGFSVAPDNDSLEALTTARRNGFRRVVINGRTIDLNGDLDPCNLVPAENSDATIIIVDRLRSDSPVSRIRESLETAFHYGNGRCLSLTETTGDDLELSGSQANTAQIEIDERPWLVNRLSREPVCGNCGYELPSPTPKLFNNNSAIGACSTCEGLGEGLKPGSDLLETCAKCNGDRLNADALGFRVGDRNLAGLLQMQLGRLADFFDRLVLNDGDSIISARMLKQVKARLGYMTGVGLGYLRLDRKVRTLSSGEAARVALTTSLSSTLVNMLYVLDEPSAGLHPQNIASLQNAIAILNERGNTVVVVDHDPEIITAADRVVEIGPGAGDAGGEIVFDGPPAKLIRESDSLTGAYLSGKRGYATSPERRKAKGRIKLDGATGHNLKNIDVEFPLGVLCVVTGVSGAGKSTLVQETLYPAMCGRLEKAAPDPLPFADLSGTGVIEDVVLFDQSPPGKSSRSNPVTYVKAFDEIRKAFAETGDAKSRNLTPKHFSFNVKGGRCDKCEGDGWQRVDMQFMADIMMKCDQCDGMRYRDEVLAVKYRGRNIAQILAMTVREAFAFFRGQVKLQTKLKALIDVGLEYISLGQSSSTMSSGEAQRLKLALHLNSTRQGCGLFILDEPTCGLHMNDVARLVECFEALLNVGHSLIIVEHDLSLIKHADWIIDLGPGAADDGGTVVATGTPEQLIKKKDSVTGEFLKNVLVR